MTTRDMTGLEILQAMIRGLLPHSPITDTFPMKCLIAKKAEWYLRSKPTKGTSISLKTYMVVFQQQ